MWLGQVLAVNDDALGAAQGFPNVLLLPGVSAVPVARAAGAAGAAAAGLLRRLQLLLLAQLLALLLVRTSPPLSLTLRPVWARPFVGFFGRGLANWGAAGGRLGGMGFGGISSDTFPVFRRFFPVFDLILTSN